MKNEEFWPQNGPTWGHLVKIKKAIHKDGRGVSNIRRKIIEIYEFL
jgi:hypothetical protein